MKSIISKLAIVLFIAITCVSCSIDMFNKVTGNRNVVTENRNISEIFTGIKVSTGLDLYLSQSSKNNISVEADENLQDIIITEVVDGILKIYSEKNIWSAKSRKVYVSIDKLNKLIATSGADVRTEGKIFTDEISIRTTSGADIRIAVDASSVETNTTSGSEIRISGNAENHASSANSGSSIKAYDLISKNVIAKVTSGADIDIYASEIFEGKANSGGDIDFKGNPKKVIKKSSSGGRISKK